MKSAKQFAETAASYATKLGMKGKPPAVLLNLILGNIERITALGRVTPSDRAQALFIAWDAYAKVLKHVNTDFDESWGGATRIGTSFSASLDIIEDENLASLVMYGAADNDT